MESPLKNLGWPGNVPRCYKWGGGVGGVRVIGIEIVTQAKEPKRYHQSHRKHIFSEAPTPCFTTHQGYHEAILGDVPVALQQYYRNEPVKVNEDLSF